MNLKRKWKKTVILLSGCMICTFAAGCGGQNSKKEDMNEVQYTERMEDLEDNHFYIEKKDGYASPYFGETSFDVSDYKKSSSSNIAWCMDDWNKIPTLYAGEKLIYKTSQELDEKFYFERFLDDGYTFGICQMEITPSGRYSLNTEADQKRFNKNSSAAALVGMGNKNVIIDSIDQVPLREGDVTESGTIQGLDKDKTYTVDLYVGTELKEIPITADSRALVSAQIGETSEYEFERNQIIEIKIPDYYNSGYYSINGSGIFRYVKGDSYGDDTDFNVMNADSEEEANALLAIENGEVNNKTEEFRVDTEGTYTVTFVYSETIPNSMLQNGMTADQVGDPNVVLNTGKDLVVFQNNGEARSLSATAVLEPGTYPVEITELYGRKYELHVYGP